MASVARALSVPLPNGARLQILTCIPFVLAHLSALAVFFVPFHWYYVLACFLLYEARMFFVTAGYHRYFSHRSFKTSRAFQFLLAFLAMSSSQKGILWWAAHHRHHHRYSDQELDLHSPTLFGFIGDFAKFPELRWLNKYYLVPPIALGAAIWLIGGFGFFVWGFCLST